MAAPWSVHAAMLQSVGLERSLIVQLMAYGDDNQAVLDGLAESASAARGIAELGADAGDDELDRLHAAGVRGLRFFLGQPRPLKGAAPNGVGLDQLITLAPRLRARGWVAEIAAPCAQIADQAATLAALDLPIVLEHMAGTTPDTGADHQAFLTVLSLLAGADIWVKLSVCRMSNQAPDFADLRPIHDALVAAAPERMLWGSDWPHVAMVPAEAPDVGHLLDLFDLWLGRDDDLRRRILCENPARLFGFDAPAGSAS